MQIDDALLALFANLARNLVPARALVVLDYSISMQLFLLMMNAKIVYGNKIWQNLKLGSYDGNKIWTDEKM
jgi:hypothetical protein